MAGTQKRSAFEKSEPLDKIEPAGEKTKNDSASIRVEANCYTRHFLLSASVLASFLSFLVLITGTLPRQTKTPGVVLPPAPGLLKFLPLLLLIALLAFAARRFTSKYHVIDAAGKSVRLHFDLPFLKLSFPVFNSGQVLGAGVSGSRYLRQIKNEFWRFRWDWQYKIALTGSDGRVVHIGTEESHTFKHKDTAMLIASVLGCRFINYPEEKQISTTRAVPGEPVGIDFIDGSILDYFKYDETQLSAIFSIAISISFLVFTAATLDKLHSLK